MAPTLGKSNGAVCNCRERETIKKEGNVYMTLASHHVDHEIYKFCRISVTWWWVEKRRESLKNLEEVTEIK